MVSCSTRMNLTPCEAYRVDAVFGEAVGHSRTEQAFDGRHNHDRNHEQADNGCGDHPSAALFHYDPFSSAPGSVCPSVAMEKGSHAVPSEIQTLIVPRLVLPLRRARVTQLVEQDLSGDAGHIADE